MHALVQRIMPAFCWSTLAAMRSKVARTCPSLTAGDAQRGAVFHQADVVDVGHLGAAHALIDPAHHAAQDALDVVVQLLLDLGARSTRRFLATGMVQQVVRMLRASASAR